MKSQLFIPKTITVGYQNRSDTYTKKLAYVIYTDDKGVLRKQKSWEGWIDKSIPTDTFDNAPHNGFVLNKDVQRVAEYFGTGRTVIRVYDDRGIEFEIKTDNLMFILMTTDCMKRGLTGNFVYAWYGKELVLLPCDCDEYRKAVGFTSLQSKKVSAKELIPGATYETKKQETLVYLGKFHHWLTQTEYLGPSGNHVQKTKQHSALKHVFQFEDKKLHICSSLAFLARTIESDPVSDLADRIEALKKEPCLNKITGIVLTPKPVKPLEWAENRPTSHVRWSTTERYAFKTDTPNKYRITSYAEIIQWNDAGTAQVVTGYQEQTTAYVKFNEDDCSYEVEYDRHPYSYSIFATRRQDKTYTLQQMEAMTGSHDIHFLLESGETIPARYF